MTCILYNRIKDKTVEIDISEFLESLSLDVYINKFKSLQRDRGLFLGLTEDKVREKYSEDLPYYTDTDYLDFLHMICEMTNEDTTIISADNMIFIGMRIMKKRIA